MRQWFWQRIAVEQIKLLSKIGTGDYFVVRAAYTQSASINWPRPMVGSKKGEISQSFRPKIGNRGF